MAKYSRDSRDGRPRSGENGKRRGSHDEADADVRSEERYQENPEVPESGAARDRAPEDDYGNGRPAENDRSHDRSRNSRERSPRSPREQNGDVEERKSHYSSQDRHIDYGSRSPRRSPADYPEDEAERRPRRRDSRSVSDRSRGGRRSNRSSPRHRVRRGDSPGSNHEDGPFT